MDILSLRAQFIAELTPLSEGEFERLAQMHPDERVIPAPMELAQEELISCDGGGMLGTNSGWYDPIKGTFFSIIPFEG